MLVYTERQFHTVTEFQNGGKRTHMPKLLYIYDFSFKFVKTKCRKTKNRESTVIYNVTVSYGTFTDGHNAHWG